jgi:hypothetical protein
MDKDNNNSSGVEQRLRVRQRSNGLGLEGRYLYHLSTVS